VNRTITTERLYYLGDYRNLKVTDTIADLPSKVVFTPNLGGKIRWIQLLEMEILHEKYLEMKGRYKDKSPEEVLALLEENRVQALQELKSILNGNLEEPKLAQEATIEKGE
jgi:hypothetical protein